jgi:hypothetical protein
MLPYFSDDRLTSSLASLREEMQKQSLNRDAVLRSAAAAIASLDAAEQSLLNSQDSFAFTNVQAALGGVSSDELLALSWDELAQWYLAARATNPDLPQNPALASLFTTLNDPQLQSVPPGYRTAEMTARIKPPLDEVRRALTPGGTSDSR